LPLYLPSPRARGDTPGWLLLPLRGNSPSGAPVRTPGRMRGTRTRPLIRHPPRGGSADASFPPLGGEALPLYLPSPRARGDTPGWLLLPLRGNSPSGAPVRTPGRMRGTRTRPLIRHPPRGGSADASFPPPEREALPLYLPSPRARGEGAPVRTPGRMRGGVRTGLRTYTARTDGPVNAPPHQSALRAASFPRRGKPVRKEI